MTSRYEVDGNVVRIEASLPYLATKADVKTETVTLQRWIISAWIASMLAYASLLYTMIISGPMQAMNQTIGLLAQQVQGQRAELTELHKQTAALQAQVSGLGAKVSALDATVSALDAKVSAFDAKLDRLLYAREVRSSRASREP